MSAPGRLLLGGLCICQCHTDETSPPVSRTAGQRGVLAVDRRSACHAVSACATCRDHHCPALSGRPPELARHFRALPRSEPAVAVPAASGASTADGAGKGSLPPA